ncbi:hypothetical protein SAMN05414139_01097 [Burkholderia sp. D7]|nr:hypothetical protein SAMN05414139_01097 [Burkholderia sp. D7]
MHVKKPSRVIDQRGLSDEMNGKLHQAEIPHAAASFLRAAFDLDQAAACIAASTPWTDTPNDRSANASPIISKLGCDASSQS